MKRILSAVLLLALSLGVLCAFGGKEPEHTGYEVYFRDGIGFAAAEKTICYVEPRWADSCGFDDQKQRLLECGAIPEMDGYGDFGCSAYYNEDGSFYEISLCWQHVAEDSYKQLSLDIVPADAPDAEDRDGSIIPEAIGVTWTEVDGIRVCGVGEPEAGRFPNGREHRNNALIFEKNGMRYQIDGIMNTTLEELGAVLDHYLRNDVDLSAFAREYGDVYELVRFSEHPDAFPGCFPDATGLPYEVVSDSLGLKNGAPNNAELHYQAVDEKGESISYVFVCAYPLETFTEPVLGALSALSADAIMSALREEGQVVFSVGEFAVLVQPGVNESEALLEQLLATLPDWPEKKETGDPMYYFRDSAGQTGTYLYAFCGTGEDETLQRRFADQFGRLAMEQAVPVIPGLEFQTVNGSYTEEGELWQLWMSWGYICADIYAPGSSLTESWYRFDENSSTVTEVNGVTVYGDGTPETEQMALGFTLPDGSQCFVVASPFEDTHRANLPAQLTAIAEFFLENGVSYDAFAMEKGDYYEFVTLEDPRVQEFLTGCWPGEEDLVPNGVELKNGQVISVALPYTPKPGKSILWEVMAEMPGADDFVINDMPFLAEAEVTEYFSHAEASAVTCMNGKAIRITVMDDGLADELWEMIRPFTLLE